LLIASSAILKDKARLLESIAFVISCILVLHVFLLATFNPWLVKPTSFFLVTIEVGIGKIELF
jgi:hypothetical protein